MAENLKGYVIAANEGPVWDMDSGRPAAFKLLSQETGGAMAVFEEGVPPGGRTPLHIHHTSDEAIYVLSGEFTFRLGEDTRQVSAGPWVFIPLGSVHGWRNSGTAGGHLFFVFTPGDGAAAFEEMRLQKVTFPEIDPAVREAVFARHAYETVTGVLVAGAQV